MGTELSPTERGTVRLCGFCHISTSTSGLGAGASPASFIAVFTISCTMQISRLSTVTASFDDKRLSLTLFPVMPKPEVLFNSQMVVYRCFWSTVISNGLPYATVVNHNCRFKDVIFIQGPRYTSGGPRYTPRGHGTSKSPIPRYA